MTVPTQLDEAPADTQNVAVALTKPDDEMHPDTVRSEQLGGVAEYFPVAFP